MSSSLKSRRAHAQRCSSTTIVSGMLVLATLTVAFSILMAIRVHTGSDFERIQESHQLERDSQSRYTDLSFTRQSDASRSLTHEQSSNHEGFSGALSERVTPLTNITSSACMLIMDDNHWLVEWLAYHYTTMNLRRLIIAIDERSKTSPIEILDRYHGRIEFTLWNDTHFFRNKPDSDNLQEINLARQQTFLAKCMQTLKSRPDAGWTMFIDTDEFIFINRRTKERSNRLYREIVPSLDQPGSILSFLEEEKKLHRTVCFSMGRLQFSPDDVESSLVERDIPTIFNASEFMTFRWLNAAGDLVGPKNIVDLSVVDAGFVPVETTHQHRVIRQYCGEKGNAWNRKNSLLQVYHYMGTYDQFNFREDARLTSQSKTKGRNGRYNVYTGKFLERADDLRPWIKAFVDLVGREDAQRLLTGVGRTTGWLDASAHQHRYGSLASIPTSWPPGGGRPMVDVASDDEDNDDDKNGDGDDNDDEDEDDDAETDNTQSDENGDDDNGSSEDDDDGTTEKEHEAQSTETTSRNSLTPGSIFYSKARPDRSGAAIADMLLAHAYAVARKLKYGGACGNEHDAFLNETLHLVESIGLQDTLRFRCPDDLAGATIVDRQLYFQEKGTLWSHDYLELLRGMIQYPSKQYSVVVHVRRGDVTPCGRYSNRYLPNSHYLDVLQRYTPNKSVVIFSESKSYESFDDFKRRNYSVRLDTSLAEVWEAIISAEYVILSKSSFSFLPAMLNRHAKNILYTPFLHPSVDGWTEVDASISARSQSVVNGLIHNCTVAVAYQ